MTTKRKLIAYTLALLIVGGHVFCFVIRKDIWPFSHYQMYAGVRAETWTHLEIAGIPEGSKAEEVALPAEGVHPPRTVRVMHGVNRLLREAQLDETKRERLDRALRGIAVLYNRELPSTRAGLPRLQGIRIYEQKWTREPNKTGAAAWTQLERVKVAEALIESST